MKDIEERVKYIVVEQLGVKESEVSNSSHFVDDLGADSLDNVELVMAMEEEFECEIPDEHAEKILTVGQAIAFIKAHAIGEDDDNDPSGGYREMVIDFLKDKRKVKQALDELSDEDLQNLLRSELSKLNDHQIKKSVEKSGSVIEFARKFVNRTAKRLVIKKALAASGFFGTGVAAGSVADISFAFDQLPVSQQEALLPLMEDPEVGEAVTALASTPAGDVAGSFDDDSNILEGVVEFLISIFS